MCTQEIGYLEFDGGSWNITFEGFSGSLVAFGEDINGELYVCSLGGDISKLVDNSLSTDEFDLSNVSVYPNPTKDVINVDFSSVGTTVDSNIAIYDIQGKLVKSVSKNSEAIQKINTTELSKGLYLLKIVAENGEQITRKLVIL